MIWCDTSSINSAFETCSMELPHGGCQFVAFVSTVTVSFITGHGGASLVMELDCMVLRSLGSRLKLIKKYSNREAVSH